MTSLGPKYIPYNYMEPLGLDNCHGTEFTTWIEALPGLCAVMKRNLEVSNPKGPKYLYGTKYGFCSSNFPYGLGKYFPNEYLGPFG